MGETAIGFIPIVGDVYDGITGIAGYSLVTSDKLDSIDRVSSLAGVIPIPFVTGKTVRVLRDVVEAACKKLGVNSIKFLLEAIPKAIDEIKRLWDKVVDTLQKNPGGKVGANITGQNAVSKKITYSRSGIWTNDRTLAHCHCEIGKVG